MFTWPGGVLDATGSITRSSRSVVAVTLLDHYPQLVL